MTERSIGPFKFDSQLRLHYVYIVDAHAFDSCDTERDLGIDKKNSHGPSYLIESY